ncbi:MAG TPA: type II toxin-antitoxin system VapC family toxin [Blastocatellia bacterium]|nr:type II toxin-antitoxin system VapC family toxin [Blastocatellia bacterium]
MTRAEVFLDTAYAIALSSPTDEHHEKALLLADELEKDRTRLITIRSVILEIGNALSKQRYRKAAIALLESLEEDANVEIVGLSEDLYEKGFELYRQRPDKEWGITDCISFVVMLERGLSDVLTTDQHFEQAGFNALLRDTKE